MDASQIAKASNPQLKQILLYLYGYQTQEEQMSEITVEQNDVGFNRIDAEILSSFAEQVKAGRELSDKQYNLLRLRLPKYHRQVNGGNWETIKLPEIVHTNGQAKKDYSQVKVAFQGANVHPGSRLEEAARFSGLADSFRQAYGPKPDSKYAGRLSIDPENGGLMFKPNVYPSKQIKDIGFGIFKNGAWHQYIVKVLPSVVADIQRLFGEIEIDPEVEEALKPAPLPDLPAWVQEQFPTLKPFQHEAIQFTMSHERLLLALAPRLGKSVVSILSADVLDLRKILVVAPLSLLRDWKNKILRWSPSMTPQDVAIVYKKNLLVQARWTITNYDTLRLHPDTFNRAEWDLIIVDETLLLKNRNAKRNQWIFELVNHHMSSSKVRQLKKADPNASTRSVFSEAPIEKPKYVWFLSGAPRSRLYVDLWAQLNILEPKQFSSYWRFADKYCIVQPTQWSKYNIVGDKPDAAQRLKEDLAHIFYTRSHEDVTDMPPMEPENLPVPMGNSQEKMYGQMEADFLAELPEDDKLMAPNILAQMTRLVQIASNPLLVGGRDDSPKWDALTEMLDFEEGPIIVWTSFIETVNQLRTKWAMKDRPIARLTGATKNEDRADIVEAFQTGRVSVLIAHPAVGKYGLDLFNAKTVIYLERGYNADDYYQSLMRVRHVDQTTAPRIVHLLSERKDGSETIDHVIDQILASRTDATKKLTTFGIRKMMGVSK
jgi:hypothetical protein